MTITTLGLDLSLTCTGVAHIASDGTISTGVVKTKPRVKVDDPTAVKLADLDRRIEEIRVGIAFMTLQLETPSFIYTESTYTGSPGASLATIYLAMLHGAIRNHYLRTDRLSMMAVPPATVAKHAGVTGRPKRDEKKREMIRLANERWGLELARKDDDIADALWLADLAQHEWAAGVAS